MADRLLRPVLVGLVVVLGLGGALSGPRALAENPDLVRSLTSTDGGNGTYSVPVLNSDVPDVSVAHVPTAESGEGRDVYYMISTTMHLSPGAPIMKSYDLVNWEIVNYVYDRLSMGDASSLRNGENSYGAGQWASTLRYHDGRFYVAFNTNNVGGGYIFWTDDVEDGVWERIALGRGFHDMSLFFDEADGGTPYLFYGGGSTSAVQLSDDLTTVVAEYPDITTHRDYPDEPGMTSAYEGQQVFWFDGYYYIPTITWPPGGGRQVVLLRSEELLGRYTAPDGENTYEARGVLDSDGFAQGSLVPVTTDGETHWHGFFFRDTFPVGRIPALIPATWSDGWPTFGDRGEVHVGDEFDHLVDLPPELAAAQRLKSVVASDDFANDAAHKAFRDEHWELPDAPDADESLLGVELLDNGDFEAGVEPWEVQYTADLEVVADGDSDVLAVSGRINNGSGPGQVLDGKLQTGVTYNSSMRVRYDEGPETMGFILGLSYGGGIKQTANAVATRGEWTTVEGSFTVPEGDDVDDVTLVVETPWGPNQTPADQVDYLVDDISFVGEASAQELPVEAEYAYNGSDLDLAWEWNHNPDNRYWSLTERPGWLRLTNGHVVTGEAEYSKAAGRELAHLEEARNTLSQRTFGPKASAEISLDVSGMLDGDVAGLATYTRSFAYAGVKRADGELTLGVVQRLQPFTDSFDQDAAEAFVPGSTVDLGGATDVHLKADADFESSPGELWVQFRYSLDGRTWQDLGTPAGPLTMDWSLSHFMGYRFGIFNYALEQTGGHVDVDHYLLSGTLSSDGQELDRSLLEASAAAAETFTRDDLTDEQWEELQGALVAARAVESPSTQNQIDAPAYRLAAVVAQLRAAAAAGPTPSPSPDPSPTPTPSASPTPSLSPDPSPSASPTAAPTPTATPGADAVDVYSTPGFHRVNGRTWHTTCEPYSQTQRCRTDIWATTVELVDDEFTGRTGWTFNNLTYLPLLPRQAWAQNPLGHAGEWTSSEGRQWRTECDTVRTGRGGCRSYIWADLVVSQQGADGVWSHRATQDWVFNNMVRFSS